MSLFHSNTERLIDYWRDRKEGRLSPLRSSIDPAAFTGFLPQTFILGRSAPGKHLFRLAGATPTDLHQRDLRGVDFLTLWARPDRPRLGAALETARRMAAPTILIAGAHARDGAPIRLEILLAPLRASKSPQDRFLGLYQPLSQIRGELVGDLELIRFGSAEQDDMHPRLRLAAMDGRLVG